MIHLPLLLLVRLHPCLRLPLLQEEVAAAERGPLLRQRQRPGLPCIGQPKLLPLHPLLHQEMPVLHWKPMQLISNTIPPCDILSTSFPPLRPLLG